MTNVMWQCIISGETIATVALVPLLFYAAVVDIKSFRIPDSINAIIALMGLALASIKGTDTVLWAVAAALIALAAIWAFQSLYLLIRKRNGLGFGDTKFIAAATTWVGLEGLPTMLLVACLAALLFVATKYAFTRSVSMTDRLPFGPFLGLGLLLTHYFGPADRWILPL